MISYNFVKEFIEKSIRENWNEPSLSDYQGINYTYSEVAAHIHRLHKTFEAWEVKPGDKISLYGRNNANWAITYLAIISYGAVVVPILADFSAANVHNIVNHSDSILLFAGELVWENIDEKEVLGVRAIFSLANFQPLIERNAEMAARAKAHREAVEAEAKILKPTDIVYPETSNDKLAVISYTSGTTGFSKGVMLPHNSLAANIDFGRKNIAIQAKDKIVSFLPLAHAYGVAFEFLLPFAVGCHITFLTKVPSPAIILQAFQEVKPRLVLAVPLILEKIYKKKILPVVSKPAVKALLVVPGLNKIIHKKINKSLTDAFGGNFLEVVIGGAALNDDVETLLRKIKFPMTIGYGMTECGPLISYTGWRKTKKGSCGQLLHTLEMKIDSPNPDKEVGEILIRGENLMYGYYKNPEATAKAIDSDGWLHTGDLGIVDKDGFIFIKGRSKSMILGPSGQNIYPEEVEARFSNLPYVQEAVVIEQNGRLVALIYPDLEATTKDGLSPDDIVKAMEQNRVEANKHLPSYSQVAAIKITAQEFEKTPKKSIKRFLYQGVEE
jgi:long-chain acyl-CoA synthetase